MRTKEIEKELETLEAQKRFLMDLLDQNKSKTRVKCEGNPGHKNGGCGKTFMVKRLEYVQIMHYKPPVSCSAGDYWYPGEGRFICPLCGYINRLYGRPEVVRLKHYFGSIREEEFK